MKENTKQAQKLYVTDAPWQTGVPPQPDRYATAWDESGDFAQTGPILAIFEDGTTEILGYCWMVGPPEDPDGLRWIEDEGWTYQDGHLLAGNGDNRRVTYWVEIESISEDLPEPYTTPTMEG